MEERSTALDLYSLRRIGISLTVLHRGRCGVDAAERARSRASERAAAPESVRRRLVRLQSEGRLPEGELIVCERSSGSYDATVICSGSEEEAPVLPGADAR